MNCVCKCECLEPNISLGSSPPLGRIGCKWTLQAPPRGAGPKYLLIHIMLFGQPAHLRLLLQMASKLAANSDAYVNRYPRKKYSFKHNQFSLTPCCVTRSEYGLYCGKILKKCSKKTITFFVTFLAKKCQENFQGNVKEVSKKSLF